MKKLIATSLILLLLIFILTKISGQKSPEKRLLAKVAVLSDSHSDNENLARAIQLAKERQVDSIIHLGDLTKVGTIEELSAAKNTLDEGKIKYYVVPGDHDLWEGGDTNFKKVFGKTYRVIEENDIMYILMDTSNTEKGITDTQITWLENQLKTNKSKIRFAFGQLPLYDPYNYRTIYEKGGFNEKVKKEAEVVLELFKKEKVLVMFSGDHHLSSTYTESSRNVTIRTVGALSRERNLQTPRFDILKVYQTGEFEIEEVVLE